MGSSIFYLQQTTQEDLEIDGLVRKESKEDLKDPKKAVNRSDSKGRGDLEIRKYLLRKDSKGVEKGKEGMLETGKMEIRKLLGRKESKAKDEKDGKAKENEKDDAAADDNSQMKKASFSEGKKTEEENEQEQELATVEEGNDEGKLEPKQELKVEQPKSRAVSPGGELRVEQPKSRSVSPGFELKADQPKSRSITPEPQLRTDGDMKATNNDPKRQSVFRLKAQFNKLDAKFRKAFSSENNASIDNNSKFYVDDEIVVIGPDGEMKEKDLNEVLEIKGNDTEEVSEEIKNCVNLLNENEDIDQNDAKPTTLGVSSRPSPRESPGISPKQTPKATPKPSPMEDTDTLEQEFSKELKMKENEDRKSSLALFDKDGNPVPPPRRKVRLSEAKQKGGKLSQSICEVGMEACAVQTQNSTQSQAGGSSSVSPIDKEKEEGFVEHRKQMPKNQGGEVTPTQTPSHLTPTPAPTSTNITSPNSKGAFKTFVSHITKMGSSHTYQGMFSWSAGDNCQDTCVKSSRLVCQGFLIWETNDMFALL